MMGLSINTNTGSLNTVRNLSMMQRSIKKTAAKLSSGKRINRAADDPAGLVISEQMRAQIGSIAQKITNLDNAINRNQTADSFLMQIEENLLEMRELAVAAASSGNVDEGMVESYEGALYDSVEALNGIAESAAFGTKKLLDGSEGSIANLKSTEAFDLSTAESAEAAIETIDQKLAQVHAVHGELGATTALEYESMRSSLEISHNNLVESESTVRDADMAREQTTFLAQMMRIKGSTAMLAQGNLVSKAVYGLVTEG